MARLSGNIAIAGAAALTLFVLSIAISMAATSQQATAESRWKLELRYRTRATTRLVVRPVDSMYGKWLKIAGTYAAQNGESAGTGLTFFGYDSQHSRWIVTGVDTGGCYFVNYSNASSFNGSQCYDGHPDMRGSGVVHLTPYTHTRLIVKA
jgi:hypothetical protein